MSNPASGFLRINSSSCKYPIPNPMGWANDRRSPMDGSHPVPCNSTIATPITAKTAGINLVKSNDLFSPYVIALLIRMNSATTATKTQCKEQITHDLLAVVVRRPSVCPR